MVLLVNMHPLRGVKMLLPIEIDESFLKVVLNWQILYCCFIHGVYCQKQCFDFINWVPSFRKANVNYREIVTYRQKFRHVLRLDLQHRSYQEFCWSTSSLSQSSKYNIRNKNLHRFIRLWVIRRHSNFCCFSTATGAILKSSVDGFFYLSPGPHCKLQPRKEHGKYNLSTTTLTVKDINGFTTTLIIYSKLLYLNGLP